MAIMVFCVSPNADKLFDKGFISFSDDGSLLISSQMDPKMLTKLGIAIEINVGAFTAQQKQYLAYHRTNTFKA